MQAIALTIKLLFFFLAFIGGLFLVEYTRRGRNTDTRRGDYRREMREQRRYRRKLKRRIKKNNKTN